MQNVYLLAGTGFGAGFLPFDSFFLSLLPMMLSPYSSLLFVKTTSN
jgi:hypothetical protein